jgi:4-carboxymuconolactone decarboxylase
MQRFVSPVPSALDEAQRSLYDGITTGPRAASGMSLADDEGRLTGPFGPMLLNPEVGNLLQATGLAFQSSWSQEPQLRELVILAVAARRGCDFEWNAHAARAAALGAPPEHIAAAREGRPSDGMDALTSAVLTLTDTLLRHDGVGDALYADVAELGGARTVFETVALIGYYETLANLFTVFAL